MVLSKTRRLPALHRYLIGFAIGAGLSVLAFVAFFASNRPDQGLVINEASYSLGPSSDKEPGSIDTDAPYDLPQLRQYESDFARSTALYSLVATSNREELVKLIGFAQDISHPSRRSETFRVIGQRLAELDPKSALELTESVPQVGGKAFVSGIFRSWSATNLDDSVEQAKFLEEPLRYEALQSILTTRLDLSESQRREIAELLGDADYAVRSITEQTASALIENPKEAWNALVNDELDNAYQIRSLERIVWQWLEVDGMEVLSHIEKSLSGSNHSREIYSLLVHNITKKDPAGAFDYLQTLHRNEMGDLLWNVGGIWGTEDPEAALAAASTLAAGSMREDFTRTVIVAWAQADPHRVLEDIGQIDEKFRINAVETAVGEIARTNPSEAARLLDGLEITVGSTANAAYSLAYRWSQNSPRDAFEWIVSESQTDNPERPRMVETALASLAREEPENAFELALQQPIGQDLQLGMEARVIAELSRIDLDSAIEFLPRVREEFRGYSAARVGVELVRQRDPLEALKLADQLVPADRNDYLATVGRTWAFSNPIQLFEALDQISNDTARSALASQLIAANDYRQVLTEDQIEYVELQVAEEVTE